MENKVTVVDSIMGTGKTSWAIQYMNEHPEQHFVFVTPFLDEVKRIIKSCPDLHFCQPDYRSGRKIDDFNLLLMEGRNIALTHSTFSNATAETYEYISNGKYVLILDEVLDILVDFNEATNDHIRHDDIKLLLTKNFISYDEYGKVAWKSESYLDSKYGNVERIAKNGNLYYLDESMLVWQFPPEIFQCFQSMYLLTYLFDGSYLKPYFDYHGIKYELADVCKMQSGKYELTGWRDDREERKRLKKLITVCTDRKLNGYDAGSLSKSWFIKMNKGNHLGKLKANLFNYFHNIAKAKSAEIMWSCFQDYQIKLQGKGYTETRKPNQEEKEFLQSVGKTEREKFRKKLKCFVPCNARATNDFRERSVLAYALNVFCNPYVKRYFSNKNKVCGTNIAVDEDKLALSYLIQWIWRSRIRDGKPIQVYIPSTRMRNLFMDWLDGK